MRFLIPNLLTSIAIGLTGAAMANSDANRLAYLDGTKPYYPSLNFPKLTTPMWVGEEGVDAVVVLSIDDMSDAAKYESYLRPILDRLKQIDGRAPVTIFANKPDPADPILQDLLQEGCSIDVHTINHPCPLLHDKGFDWASDNVHDCTTLLNSIPNNKAVAYRMPCCDSQNTPSPRFYEGIFDKTTKDGAYLSIDSSVFNITTPNDPDLPRDLVLDPDGRERFRKYLPFPSFVNTIEDYPYPYVINKLCWEFPAMVPSDWEAQNLNGVNAPRSVEDMKAAIDVAVLKKGVYTLVFHPHGWIENTQVVDLIDHVVAKHGKKVKFLNFPEIQQRLDQHLLDGNPLRDASGNDNGVRLLDLNEDGYLDVVVGNTATQQTRVWNAQSNSWMEQPLPFQVVDGSGDQAGVRFVPNLDPRGAVVAASAEPGNAFAYAYTREGWSPLPDLAAGLADAPHEDAFFRDVDGNGSPELLDVQSGIKQWDAAWKTLDFGFPKAVIEAGQGAWPAAARFVDLDEDGDLDIVLADGEVSGVYLFQSIESGWSENVLPEGETIPAIAIDGKNNGAWFHSRHLWVMNENTATLPDLVDRRSFNELLAGVTPEARSPEASRDAIRVRPGYEVELVAAEPLVADPISLAWAADGGLYVVEMRDYPDGLDGDGAPGSRIRLLRDDDGDGKYDSSTIFYDGMAFATGCHPWRDGLLVTCAPELFYLEDTDGDDVADTKEVIFAGFGEGNQQHRVNGLRWGLDNWMYGANGDSSGQITSVLSEDTLSLRGRDFRFNPDTGRLDGQKGQTQYGRAMDDWGNWFGCNNSNPLYHFTLKEEYARRNPAYPFQGSNKQVFAEREAFAISRHVTRFNEHFNANKFTSVCGLDFYRDSLLGEAFYGNAFIAEPVHNLILRMEVEPEGATFTGQRPAGEEDREFLASTDNWFRPVMVRTGPDGALWIADMYREHIEHTEYISEVDQGRFNFLNGNDKGRIYRVFPVGAEPRPFERLDNKTAAELVEKLSHPNSWVRETAHRLLYERQDKSAVAPLEAMVLDDSNPIAQMHALNVLDGMDALKDGILMGHLVNSDTPTALLAHVVRLAEERLAASPDLSGHMVILANTKDPALASQVAYSLGASDDPRIGVLLGKILTNHRGDPYVADAVFSALTPANLPEIRADLIAYLRSDAIGADEARSVVAMAVRLSEAADDVETLEALAGAVTEPGAANRFRAATTLLDTARGALFREALLGGDAGTGLLTPAIADARDSAAANTQPEAVRIGALSLLGRQPAQREADLALAEALIDPRTPLDVARGAIDAVRRCGGANANEGLLAGWNAYTHALRGAVLDALLAQPAGVEAVLAHMESGAISPRQMDAGHRQQLLTSQNAAVRERVEAILAGLIDTDRAKVIARYQEAADLTGDANQGQKIYAERCATCHQIGDMGYIVGPDLAAAGSGTFDTLLTAIFDPNRAVEGRYTAYTVETEDFQTFSGVLSGESANSITLANAGGIEQTILRTDIASMEAGDRSIMPEGLEEGLESQDIADLIAYIRGGNRNPKPFEGNTPTLVEPGEAGALELLATNAEIYGETLVYEPTYRNLGYWASANDHAVWRVKVPAETTYEVTMEYCCDASTAGNLYRLEAGSNLLNGRVAGTGTWDRYREITIGKVSLQPGEQRIVFRSDGPIDQFLIDLRGLRLTPAN